jgi:hypothetical protein
LGNELLELSLEFLVCGLHGLFNGLNDLRELLDLVLGFFQAELIFLFRLKQPVLFDLLVHLVVEVNLIAHSLELVTNLLQELTLDDEISNILNVHTQVANALSEPNLVYFNALTSHLGKK